MRPYLTAIYATGLLTLVISAAAGQIQPRVAGLEGNAEYLELLQQEQTLQIREDSLNKAVAEVRNKFREDPGNRQEFGQLILKLEGEIFEARNDIGITAGRITAIEQEFIITSLNSGGSASVQAPQSDTMVSGDPVAETSANLVENEIFRLKLPVEDYQALLDAQGKEAAVAADIDTYISNYHTLADIAGVYAGIDSAALADSVYARYTALAQENEALAGDISARWESIFDDKQYAYNYLLDRLNKMDMLADFDKRSQQMRETVAAQRETVMSPAVSGYPIQKGFMLDYERAIAGMLGLKKTADSLGTARMALDRTDFSLPKLEVEERLFLDYADIEVASPPKYNSRNPIPECAVYEKGVIYRILLGSYKVQQAVSIFKGVAPLGYIKNEEGRFDYYAGGFDSLGKAQAARDAMQKLGFRTPRIAMWDYGQYSLLEEAPNGQTLYRIEIGGAGESLPDGVKEIMSREGIQKEISRNGAMFIIAPFDSREEADTLAGAIEQADENLTAEVTEFTI